MSKIGIMAETMAVTFLLALMGGLAQAALSLLIGGDHPITGTDWAAFGTTCVVTVIVIALAGNAGLDGDDDLT